jgi:hypothetical protein
LHKDLSPISTFTLLTPHTVHFRRDLTYLFARDRERELSNATQHQHDQSHEHKHTNTNTNTNISSSTHSELIALKEPTTDSIRALRNIAPIAYAATEHHAVVDCYTAFEDLVNFSLGRSGEKERDRHCAGKPRAERETKKTVEEE